MNAPVRSEQGAGPQPSLNRAFLEWLDEVRHRLAVAICIHRSGPDGIEFSFAVANPVLVGALITGGELVASAQWEGECWDFLFAQEARPRKASAGYVCWICDAEGKHRVFSTIEDLWRDHLFRPHAQAVALHRTDDGGATCARLVSADDQVGSAKFLVPLR
jgi:hypothetical protein